ncbi:septum formation initiator family protein [Candidatus Peregrinibacteria bacterium]|nr:septum formation initiator family protein [Candidatus Peregrinibacteria bacterium]
MSLRFSHTSGLTKMIIIIEFILVAYLVYSLTKNVYDSYLVDQYIETFKEENARIEADNKQKNEDYLYFTSEEYIDKIAKQNLGLVNPGEEVIVLSPEVLIDEVNEEMALNDDVARYSGLKNSEKWWQFFFGE